MSAVYLMKLLTLFLVVIPVYQARASKADSNPVCYNEIVQSVNKKMSADGAKLFKVDGASLLTSVSWIESISDASEVPEILSRIGKTTSTRTFRVKGRAMADKGVTGARLIMDTIFVRLPLKDCSILETQRIKREVNIGCNGDCGNFVIDKKTYEDLYEDTSFKAEAKNKETGGNRSSSQSVSE